MISFELVEKVQAAPNNGSGIVYHRSDCGEKYTRYYGGGGRMSGSKCGEWIAINGCMLKVIRAEGNHNWYPEEAMKEAHKRGWFMVGTEPRKGRK